MKFKKAKDIKFDVPKNDEKEAILEMMQIDDAHKIHVPFNTDLKAWRNCAYRYGARTVKQFSVMKAGDEYYVVRSA